MLDTAVASLLESGAGLLLGVLDPDGRPYATRAWAAHVEGDHLRLVVDGTDPILRASLTVGAIVAVTGADVHTLRSVQFKGPVVSVEEAGLLDRARARRQTEQLFAKIHEVDGTSIDLLARIVPNDYAVCTMQVRDGFDQTPGPGAGAPR